LLRAARSRALLHAGDGDPPARVERLPRRPRGPRAEARDGALRAPPGEPRVAAARADRRAPGRCPPRARRGGVDARAAPRARRDGAAGRPPVSARSLVARALAIGLAISLAMTFPLVLHLGSRVLEDGSFDPFQFLWNIWWVRESLVVLHTNPFFTRLLFYPEGV